MPRFIIKENGVEINRINASLSFVQSNFEEYEEILPAPLTEDQIKANEKFWRDEELQSTDWIVPVVDHPQHAVYLTYRQALRDWPNTPEFPNTRPTLGN